MCKWNVQWTGLCISVFFGTKMCSELHIVLQMYIESPKKDIQM